MTDDDAKKLILARRARFIAAALAAAGLATGAEACGGNAERDVGAGGSAQGGSAQTGSGGSTQGSGGGAGSGVGGVPQPCLSIAAGTGNLGTGGTITFPTDAGAEGGEGGVQVIDAGPMPCLSPPN